MGEEKDTAGATEPVLVQTRDVTRPEAMQIYAVAAGAQMQGMRRDPLLWLCYAVIVLSWPAVIAGSLALSIAFSDPAATIVPYASNALTILMVGLSFLFLTFFTLNRRIRSVAARSYSRIYAKGNRYFLHPDGLGAEMLGTNWLIPWRRIASVANDTSFLVATAPPVQAIALPKDAFAGQDVAGFCAELERQWQAAVGAASDEH